MKYITTKTLIISFLTFSCIHLTLISFKYKKQRSLQQKSKEILQKYSPYQKEIYQNNKIDNQREKQPHQYVKQCCAKYSTNVSIPYFIKYLKKYGFGACGPRGFLGSFTPHLLLERDIGTMYGQTGLVFSTAATVFESIITALHCQCLFLIENQYPELNRAIEAVNTIQFKSLSDFINNFVQSSQQSLQEDIQQLVKDNKCQKVCAFTKKQYIKLNQSQQKLFQQICQQSGIRLCLYDDTFPIIDNTINYSDFDVICGNFEEAFGIPGGFSASCECLNGTFRTNCPGYVYSASCPPALVASVRYMIRYANKIIQ